MGDIQSVALLVGLLSTPCIFGMILIILCEKKIKNSP